MSMAAITDISTEAEATWTSHIPIQRKSFLPSSHKTKCLEVEPCFFGVAYTLFHLQSLASRKPFYIQGDFYKCHTWNFYYLRTYRTKLSENWSYSAKGLTWICIKNSLKMVKICNFHSYFKLMVCFSKMIFFNFSWFQKLKLNIV